VVLKATNKQTYVHNHMHHLFVKYSMESSHDPPTQRQFAKTVSQSQRQNDGKCSGNTIERAIKTMPTQNQLNIVAVN